LHLGSLVTAVASFLHARQSRGEWLVRIEDIDPPREARGAADRILAMLDAFELTWDREVLYQSTRREAYDAVAEQLLAAGLAFRCRCSRSEIRAANDGESGRYPGTCRHRRVPAVDSAVRMRVDTAPIRFEDALQGEIATDLGASLGDYVVVRRDGLPAYHLAVVLDDGTQGVTTIVRGVDLLDSTAAHIHLQRALGLPTPEYFHLPVLVDERRQKLSKQTGAPAIEGYDAATAVTVLGLLGLEVPPALVGDRAGILWQWALDRFDITALRGKRELAAPR
jgi:glutamyl-Q tRNA(Asp) synthetase